MQCISFPRYWGSFAYFLAISKTQIKTTLQIKYHGHDIGYQNEYLQVSSQLIGIENEQSSHGLLHVVFRYFSKAAFPQILNWGKGYPAGYCHTVSGG